MNITAEQRKTITENLNRFLGFLKRLEDGTINLVGCESIVEKQDFKKTGKLCDLIDRSIKIK